MKKITKNLIPLILCVVAMYLFFQREYIWSGCVMVIAGVAGAFFGGISSELIVLIGFLLISIEYNRKFPPFIASIIVIDGIYNLIQFYKIMKEMKSDEAHKNQDTLQDRLREKNLLRRLFKKVLKMWQGVK